MKHHLFTPLKGGWGGLLLLVTVPCAFAQGSTLSTLYVETRLSSQSRDINDARDHDASGFKGEYLNVRLDGQIAPHWTFSYRQRLNRIPDRTFFDATDWIHVDWQASSRLALSMGKEVVSIGGYEYDRAPIDLYTCSEFWGNIPCYQLGASLHYNLTPSDQLHLQFCNSPFRATAGNDTYALNLLWSGTHGPWQTLWSTNMLEYAPGHWINYLALGNRVTLSRHLSLDLDLMNRATTAHPFLLRDCSLMAELNLRPNMQWRLYGKYTYDVNRSGSAADLCVLDGTEMHGASCGVEYHPLSAHPDAMRFFFDMSHAWGRNANEQPFLRDQSTRCTLGFRLRIHCL